MNKGYKEINFTEFVSKYCNEDNCRKLLLKHKFPNGFKCDKCNHNEYKQVKGRKEYYCPKCSKQFSILKNTIMQGSHLSLTTWFSAIFLIARDKRGISALALSRELGISYRAARLMSHNIKNAMSKREADYLLGGLIVMDELFIGRIHSGKKGRSTNKAKVIAALSNNEEGYPEFVKFRLVDKLDGDTIENFTKDSIEKSAEIKTDNYLGYLNLSKTGYNHSYIEEEPEEAWVKGFRNIHTVISNLKSFIQGTYHGLSKETLQQYLDEYAYRFNRRKCIESIFSRLIIQCLNAKRLRYQDILYSV